MPNWQLRQPPYKDMEMLSQHDKRTAVEDPIRVGREKRGTVGSQCIPTTTKLTAGYSNRKKENK